MSVICDGFFFYLPHYSTVLMDQTACSVTAAMFQSCFTAVDGWTGNGPCRHIQWGTHCSEEDSIHQCQLEIFALYKYLILGLVITLKSHLYSTMKFMDTEAPVCIFLQISAVDKLPWHCWLGNWLSFLCVCLFCCR